MVNFFLLFFFITLIKTDLALISHMSSHFYEKSFNQLFDQKNDLKNDNKKGVTKDDKLKPSSRLLVAASRMRMQKVNGKLPLALK